MRLFLLCICLAANAAFAEGPGSQIRSGPSVAPPTTSRPQPADTQRCNSLRGEAKQQCLREAGAESISTTNGPESTGMGSGSGAGSGAGQSGGGSFGASAPR